MLDKRKIVIFPNPSRTKIFGTDKENYDSNIFNGNKVFELENFVDLDDARDFLEKTYGYEVEIKF